MTKPPPLPRITLDELRAADQLRARLRRFLRQSEQIVRAHGLTEERYELLLAIKSTPDDDEAATVKRLSDRLQLARSSATQLVRRAENLGLLRREVAPDDARIHHLHLTEEGERRLATAFAALRGERERLTKAVDAGRQVGSSRAR